MKKLILSIVPLAALFMLAACQTEQVLETVTCQTPGEMTFTASFADNAPASRTQLSADGLSVLWDARDVIDVFSGSAMGKFTSTNTEPAATTTFTGNLDGDPGELYYAVYPSNNSNYMDGGVLNITLPNEMTAVPGNAPRESMYTVARTAVGTDDLAFYNVLGGIKLKFTNGNFNQIEIKGNNKEFLAGNYSVEYDNNDLPELHLNSYANMKLTVNLPNTVSSFGSESWYYIPLPPTDFTKGFTLTLRSDSQSGVYVFDKHVTVRRSAWGKLTVDDSTVEFFNSSKLYYTSTDGNIVEPNDASAFNTAIVSNVYEDGQGVITFDGPLTTIGMNAFLNRANLASVVIPEGVTTVDHNAFKRCHSLTTVYIPASLENFGYRVFLECENLGSFTGPLASSDGRCVVMDGAVRAFAPAGLSSYVVSEGITTIGNSAFYGCGLNGIVLPSTLERIEYHAFTDMYKLTGIFIPESVSYMPEISPFSGCDNLSSFGGKYASADGRSLIVPLDGGGSRLLSYAYRDIPTVVNVPDGITQIGSLAFFANNGIKRLILPASLSLIGSEGLKYCQELEIVEMHRDGVVFLADPESALVDVPANFYVPASQVDAYKDSEKWINVAERIFPLDEVPQMSKIYYTTTDGDPMKINNPTVFGSEVLSNEYDNGQWVITFVGEINAIGDNAFNHCETIETITIPSTVTSIGNYAFYYCSSLKAITIPSSVKTIGQYAFYGCSALKDLTLENGIESFDYCAFCTAGVTSLNLPPSVKSIGQSAFASCLSLTTVSFNEGLESIGQNAFYNTQGLTTVTLPSTLQLLNYYAFQSSALQTVTFLSSSTEFRTNPFINCQSLSSINGIYASADGRCLVYNGGLVGFAPYGLTEYVVPEGITSVAQYAFYNCSAITNLTLPSSISVLKAQAFEGCTGFQTITLAATVPPELVVDNNKHAFTGANSESLFIVPSASLQAYKTADVWKDFAYRITSAVGGHGGDNDDVGYENW